MWTRRLPHNQMRSLRQGKCQTASDEKNADTGFREQWSAQIVPKILRCPESLCVSMMMRLILHTPACHDDFSKEGTSRGVSRVVFHSSSLAVCNFSDSAVLEIRCGLSSPGTWLCSSSTRSHSSRSAFCNVSPRGIRKGFHRQTRHQYNAGSQ